MLPRLVLEILILYAFCDVVGGIGDSRSWMISNRMKTIENLASGSKHSLNDKTIISMMTTMFSRMKTN